MTPQWRTVLRVRALLQALLDNYVALGTMGDLVQRVASYSDSGLVDGYGGIPSLTAGIARQLGEALIGEPEGQPGATATATWHGQREKWRALIEHIRDRRQAILEQTDREALVCGEGIARELQDLLAWIGKHQPDPRPSGEPRDLLRVLAEVGRRREAAQRAFEASADQGQNAVVGALDDLLAFMRPLHGATIPQLEALGEWLDSEAFYEVMQAYRHASIVPQDAVALAFDAVKQAILQAARR